MLAILSSLNAPNFPIFQPILMILVSKFMVHRALSDRIILIIRVADPFKKSQIRCNRESQAQFESRIKPRV